MSAFHPLHTLARLLWKRFHQSEGLIGVRSGMGESGFVGRLERVFHMLERLANSRRIGREVSARYDERMREVVMQAIVDLIARHKAGETCGVYSI